MVTSLTPMIAVVQVVAVLISTSSWPDAMAGRSERLYFEASHVSPVSQAHEGKGASTLYFAP
ncbi:hypothetical protein SsS58_01122 [Streptomyces scabiei]|uniref:Uncharacterized protein n=1 Tax=Streptomyces scabiei TaxID=1930 RepID=A0A100JJR0_STRSC|nr:hypothetical protein SsS58_01122 [Streptomyces scabiei]